MEECHAHSERASSPHFPIDMPTEQPDSHYLFETCFLRDPTLCQTKSKANQPTYSRKF